MTVGRVGRTGIPHAAAWKAAVPVNASRVRLTGNAPSWRRAVGQAGTWPLRAPAPWPRYPGHPRHPGQRLPGASRWGQAHWDNAHLARCVHGQWAVHATGETPVVPVALRRPMALREAHPATVPREAHPATVPREAHPATVLGVLGVLGVLVRPHSNEIPCGRPANFQRHSPSGWPAHPQRHSPYAAWKVIHITLPSVFTLTYLSFLHIATCWFYGGLV